ncbi:MAG: hypothetical protein NXI30_15780 [bacterium]|nr:hypothetical protein [bacterium]
MSLFSRRPEAGTSELLNPAAMVDEGVMLNKDGAVLAGWRLHGPDLESADAAELEALSARIHRALRSLGNGHEIHFQSVRSTSRRYAAAGDFPDPTSMLIEDERRRDHESDGRHYESQTYFTLTYLVRPDTERRALRFFLESSALEADVQTELLAAFSNTCERLEDQLGNVFELERLDSVDLLSLMKFCITGIEQRMRIPVPPMYLDYHLAPTNLRVGLTPMVGDQHVRVVAITDFPAESSPAMLDELSSLSIVYRWSVRFLPLDLPTAEARLKVIQRQWFQKRKGLMSLAREVAGDEPGPEDGDADHMAVDASTALALASEGELRFGYFTSVVVLFDEDVQAVDESARAVLKAIHGLGFSGRIEDVNSVEAYLGSIPGHGFRNVRRPIMHSLNLADMIPSTTIWTGDRRGSR